MSQAPLLGVHFGPGIPAPVVPTAPLPLQLLAMCGVTVGWYALVQLPSSDVVPFLVGLVGLALGLVVANLAAWPHRVFRLLPAAPVALFGALLVAALLSLLAVLFTSAAGVSGNSWTRSVGLTALLAGGFGTSLDWRRPERLRLAMTVSAIGLLPLLFQSEPVGPPTIVLWLVILAVVFRQTERAVDAAGLRLPSSVLRRVTDGGDGRGGSSVFAFVLAGVLLLVLVVANLRPKVPDVVTPDVPAPTFLGRIFEMLGRIFSSLAPNLPAFDLPSFSLPVIGDISLPRLDLWFVLQVLLYATVALVVAAALTPLVLWIKRRIDAERARPWAIRFAERVARAGRRRGCARARGESIERYLATLAGGVLPDPRLVAVGPDVSRALFAPGPLDAELVDRIDAVVDTVLHEHPLRGYWWRRVQASAGATWRSVRRWLPGGRSTPGADPPDAEPPSLAGTPVPVPGATAGWQPPPPNPEDPHGSRRIG